MERLEAIAMYMTDFKDIQMDYMASQVKRNNMISMGGGGGEGGGGRGDDVDNNNNGNNDSLVKFSPFGPPPSPSPQNKKWDHTALWYETLFPPL